MKRTTICAGTLLLAAVIMQPVATMAEKIAVVNVETVIQRYEAARAAEARLEERAQEYSEEHEQMLQHYRGLQQTFETLRDESFDQALTEEARRNRRNAAETKMREMAEYEQEIRATATQRRQQLEQQRQRIFSSLLDTIRAAIRRQAESEDVTLVLDASEVPGSVSAVLYHQPEHDMTDAVIDRLNATAGLQQTEEERGIEPVPVPEVDVDIDAERVFP